MAEVKVIRGDHLIVDTSGSARRNSKFAPSSAGTWRWTTATRVMLRVTQTLAVAFMVAGVVNRDESLIGPVCALWVLAYGWAWLDRNR